MNNIQELSEKIQRLENFYAESLAGNADHIALYNIWKEIKKLREQLNLHESNSLS